jgi:hypothetical protein
MRARARSLVSERGWFDVSAIEGLEGAVTGRTSE